MLTNRIKVTFNMENIDADFDIFKVDKANKDYHKYDILDLAVHEFKAEAVQWSFGATALVLFRKGDVTELEFKESITKEYEDVKIQKIDLFDSEQCENCFYFEYRLLAQLLLNSLRTPKYDDFKYNNLTGKLYYTDPSWIKKDKKGVVQSIHLLNIFIDPGMYLNLYVETFKIGKKSDKQLYVIDEKTGEFRKKLKSDANVCVYKKGALSRNRFTVKNFNITSINDFRKSKLGIMYRFLEDVKENLSKYMTIDLTKREAAQEHSISKLEKKGISEKEYGEILQKKGVVIVDELNSEKSKEIISKLQDELEKYYHVKASTGSLSKEAYNIRMIHNDTYYEQNELYDIHCDALKGYIVQHITEEAELFKKTDGSSPAIKKIVQELIIKGDVQERMISIFDWDRFHAGKDWTFVIRKRVENNLEKNEDKVVKYYNYYRLKISSNGGMVFDTFCDMNQEENGEWSKICTTYGMAEYKHKGAKNKVDGILYSNIDNIHVILLTCEQTLPNISALFDTLMKTDVKDGVSKKLLQEAIDNFEENTMESREVICEWKKKIAEAPEIITKKNIKIILNMKTNIAKKLNRFIHENYNIWIYGEIKSNEFDAIYQIRNLINIKYEYNENDYLCGKSFVYYVGDKSKKQSYPNACRIRKVFSIGDEIEFEELLPLMTVEFVRNSQYTVIPFPFKYLREYAKQC